MIDLSEIVGATIVAVAVEAELCNSLGGIVLSDGRVVLFTQPEYEEFDFVVMRSEEFEERVRVQRRANELEAKLRQRHSDAFFVPEGLENEKNNQVRPREGAIPAGYGGYLEMPDAEPWPTRSEDIDFLHAARGITPENLAAARERSDKHSRQTLAFYAQYRKGHVFT